MTRAHFAADPNEVIRTIRGLITACDQERERLSRELQHWLTAAGRRPDDGSDQPALFDPRAQPTLW